jgi:hypothetical protein
MRSVSNQYHISPFVGFEMCLHNDTIIIMMYYLICDRNGLTSSTALKMAATASVSARATLRFAAATGGAT